MFIHLVCNDSLTRAKKGMTVLTDEQRIEAVRHCRWVDAVIANAPWTIDESFMERHAIDFVAHDAIPYTSKESADVYSWVKKQGRFLSTNRTNGISTSDIITKIVRDYDIYLRRNFERGVPAKDLNISFLKVNQIN